MSNSKKAFTLIELLVVISIIALLLAILMPALQRVKQQGQSVVCKSNLKQMAMAMVMYCQENDDRLLTLEWSSPPPPIGKYWFYQLRPYLGLDNNSQYDPDEQLAIGFCPSTKAPRVPQSNAMGTAREYWQWDYNPTAGEHVEGSYGINLWATVYVINGFLLWMSQVMLLIPIKV